MNHQLELVRSIIIACCQGLSAAQHQQQDDRRRGSRLKVFLNSHTGFEDQLRADIDFVQYVNDCRQADVQVRVTDSPGRNGRREYHVAFTGQGRFEDIHVLAQVGVARRAGPESATTEIDHDRSDTSTRHRRGASRERIAIIA